MAPNADKPNLWKADVERSIDFYNDWFPRFAPETYRAQRKVTTAAVLDAFGKTKNLRDIAPSVLHDAPGLLPIRRMATAPPLARDRLMGLARVGKSLIDALEGKEDRPPRLPQRMKKAELTENLRKLRDYPDSRVTLLSVHRFNADDVQFDDALVSSCTVTHRKTRPADTCLCEVSNGGNHLDPQERRTVPVHELRRLHKWTLSHSGQGDVSSETPRLKDLFSVRRGIATGANDFFIIDSETAARFEMPRTFLKPILPGPRYLRDPIIRATADGLPDVSGFRYLVDCPLSPDQVRGRYPGLWRYLQEGVARGVSSGCLCAQKDVWYHQERRAPAPFLASYMGRATGNRECPIRCFVNFSDAIVTNVFLNLYPTSELAACLDGDGNRMVELGTALNNVPAECILHAGRAYGGGLHKIEPKELLEVPVASAPGWLSGALDRQLVLIRWAQPVAS